LLNKIHRYRIPWAFRDGELLEQSVGFMRWNLGAGTRSTGFNIILYKGTYVRPGIFMMDELKSAVLAEMTG